MGIVFTTVIENIKSFFRREEELLHDPMPAPESARESFGSQKIVEKKLDNSSTSQNRGIPQERTAQALPSAHDLRAALQKKQANDQTSTQRPQQTTNMQSTQPVQQHLAERHEEVHDSFELSPDDLRAFEEAFEQTNQQTTTSNVSASPARTNAPLRKSLPDGFFSSFKQYVEQGPGALSLDGDLLHKMRVFHQQRLEGKEPLLHEEGARGAIMRRLEELQSLEHEWQVRFSEVKDLERLLVHLEEEIDERTRALQNLLHDAKRLSDLSRECSQEQAFVFSDGSSVRSVSALLRSLRNDKELFAQHVNGVRNDFASWIEAVFDNSELAGLVRKVDSVDELLVLLKK